MKLIGLAILGFVFVPDSSAAAHWRALFPYSHHCFIPTAFPICQKNVVTQNSCWGRRKVHVHAENQAWGFIVGHGKFIRTQQEVPLWEDEELLGNSPWSLILSDTFVQTGCSPAAWRIAMGLLQLLQWRAGFAHELQAGNTPTAKIHKGCPFEKHRIIEL